MSISSLANLYSPSNFEELPWIPEEKEELRIFMQDVFENIQQPLYLLVGTKGSGKSLLLRSLFLPLYFQLLQQEHPKLRARTLAEFRASNVMLITPYRHDQSTLRNSVLNFVQMYSAFPGKRILLVDDADLCTNAEIAVIHMILHQRHFYSKVCILVACRETNSLSSMIAQHARIFYLPYPQLHEVNLRYFTQVIKRGLGVSADPERLKRWWREGSEQFEGMFDVLDRKCLAAAEGEEEEENDYEVQLRNFLQNCRRVEKDASVLFSELLAFADQGFSVADLTSMLWKMVSGGDAEDDGLASRLLLFMSGQMYTEASSEDQYQRLLEALL